MLYQLGVCVFVFLSHTKKIKRLKKKLNVIYFFSLQINATLILPYGNRVSQMVVRPKMNARELYAVGMNRKRIAFAERKMV